jgi:hypothetical protein
MKEYLGDSVYAAYDGDGIMLTTENGAGPSNEIFMDPDTIKAFMRFVQQLSRDRQCSTPDPTTTESKTPPS